METEEFLGDGSIGPTLKIHDSGNVFVAKKNAYDLLSNNVKFSSRIFTSLDFPTLNKIIDLNEFEITSNFISQPSLKEILADQNRSKNILNPTNSVIAIIGIAAGIQYLHQNNIPFLSLYPTNIFFSKEDPEHVKLTDFGISQLSPRIKAVQLTGNFLSYLPPQYFTNNYDDLKKVDVYSFGKILWSIFSKKLLDNPTDLSRFFSRNEQLIDFPSSAPDFYKNLYKCCCSPDPSARPSFSDVLYFFFRTNSFDLPGYNKAEVQNYIKYLSQYKLNIGDGNFQLEQKIDEINNNDPLNKIIKLSAELNSNSEVAKNKPSPLNGNNGEMAPNIRKQQKEAGKPLNRSNSEGLQDIKTSDKLTINDFFDKIDINELTNTESSEEPAINVSIDQALEFLNTQPLDETLMDISIDKIDFEELTIQDCLISSTNYKLLENLAKTGDPKASYSFGLINYSYDSNPISTASNYFTKASERKGSYGLYASTILKLLSPDLTKIEDIKKAAENGDRDAMVLYSQYLLYTSEPNASKELLQKFFDNAFSNNYYWNRADLCAQILFDPNYHLNGSHILQNNCAVKYFRDFLDNKDQTIEECYEQGKNAALSGDDILAYINAKRLIKYNQENLAKKLIRVGFYHDNWSAFNLFLNITEQDSKSKLFPKYCFYGMVRGNIQCCIEVAKYYVNQGKKEKSKAHPALKLGISHLNPECGQLFINNFNLNVNLTTQKVLNQLSKAVSNTSFKSI